MCEEEIFIKNQKILEIIAPRHARPFSGTYSSAAWMIPIIVSVIGIGIVIARKF